MTKYGASINEKFAFPLMPTEQHLVRHPVILHLKSLSPHTICNPLHPLTLCYSPITKELLFILAHFLLLGSIQLCVLVCKVFQYCLGKELKCSNMQKSCETSSLTHSFFPLTFNFTLLDSPETFNNFICD